MIASKIAIAIAVIITITVFVVFVGDIISTIVAVIGLDDDVVFVGDAVIVRSKSQSQTPRPPIRIYLSTFTFF